MTPHSLEPGPSVYLNSVSPTASMPSHRQLGQKRTYSGASVMGRKAIPRDAAPPAVPEFGTKPVIPSLPSQGKGPKLKKKRKHNQLGLTPKTEEHESSEEEQDMDEELKLAAAQPSVALGYLEFSYKGRVATLRSSSEIAAWIEERKKRYPTKKRAEEEARRKENLRQAERTAAELGTKKSKAGKAEYDKKRINVADVAKARQKAEKLRKKYQKAERRVAEIEAETLTKTNVLEDDVSQRQKCGFGRNVEDMSSSDTLLPAPKPDDGTGSKTTEARSVQSPSKQNTDLQESFEHPASLLPEDGTRPEQWTVDQHPNDSLSKPCIPDVKLPSSICEKPPVPEILLGNHDASVPSDTLISMVLNDRDLLEDLDNASLSDSSELSPSGEDDTSSSGSSTDSNSPPEVYPKRIESDCAVPQNFAKKKSICKLFLSKGFCSRGDRCQYLHELPKRGSGKLASSKNGNTEGTPRTRLKKERTSLYQRILMQQEEKEDELALEHIILLGENGALDDQKAGN
ncbi:hypothetical protein MMC13_002967 [Lambiella insularis]|nr:hypothetical protein [Lambiella insularis]